MRSNNPPHPNREMDRIDRELFSLGETSMVTAGMHRMEVDISPLSGAERRTVLEELVRHNVPGMIFSAGNSDISWIVCLNPGGKKLWDALWSLIVPAVDSQLTRRLSVPSPADALDRPSVERAAAE